MLFRNRRLARAIACFFLLEAVTMLAAPGISWAVMGPSQPEFTSYEAPGGTDMVNLSTGDFTYSIPVLDIPGPERSFSLPLSYHAGIQLEQEASWVGLGWSLNAGAINRSVNGYPDDACDDPVTMTYNKSLAHGETHWIILGLWRGSYDSVQGVGGSVDLLGLASVNWDKDGITGGDLVGIGYDKDKGMTVDPVRMAAAVLTIATLGAASEIGLAANVGIKTGVNAAMEVGAALVFGRQGGVSGFNNLPREYHNSDWVGSWYGYDYRNTNKEYSYGSLHFGRMAQSNGATGTGPVLQPNNGFFTPRQSPQFNASRTIDASGTTLIETAADVYQSGTTDDGNYYSASTHPISTAHDFYNVMGEGATGNIRPYRLEVGSVAYPKFGRNEPNKHSKYNAVPFLNNYKVPFRYENSLSNTYEYHQPANPSNSTGFAVSRPSGNEIIVSDSHLYNTYARTEAVRKGITQSAGQPNQLVQGKHTVWYTNEEILGMAGSTFSGYNNGFLNFEVPRQLGAVRDVFRSSLPRKGIGAFAVTIEDGTTYHYSLPVYNYKTYTQSFENNHPNRIGDGFGYATKKEGFGTNGQPVGYATTWLLTAITSPDFLDRNHSGTADAGDWGGWVNFKYGKFSSRYKWRQPYIGTSYSDEKNPVEYEGHAEGFKETYFLNKISTRTHTALFVKSVREDGRGHFSGIHSGPEPLDPALSIYNSWPASSLRLDEAILLDNETLARLETQNGIRESTTDPSVPALSNNTNNNSPICNEPNGPSGGCWGGDDIGQVLDAADLDADPRIRSFIEANALKRIRFNYSYELCRGTPSSFAYSYGSLANYPLMDVAHMYDNRSGKLTLKSISFFGPTVNSRPTKLIPDFAFGYNVDGVSESVSNPRYELDKWDGFGMYKPTGTRTVTGHLAEAGTPPWTLTWIQSPLGGLTKIKYERDDYAHVSEFGTRRVSLTNNGGANNNGTLTFSIPQSSTGSVNLNEIWPVNSVISLVGTVNFVPCACLRGVTPVAAYPTKRIYGELAQIQGISSSNGNWNVTVSWQLPTQLAPDESSYPDGAQCLRNYTVSGMTFESAVPWNTVGGDVRVAAVTTSDPVSHQTSEARYQYQVDGPAQANSSGVLAKEPSFVNRLEHKFYTYFDYPNTPIIYSQVTVLRGLFRNNNAADFNQREVYKFHTPASGMVSEQSASDYQGGLNFGSFQNKTLALFNNNVTVSTGLIGRPKAVEVYNARNQSELATSFDYSNQASNTDNIARQGYFTEGVLNNEMLDLDGYRVNRTTKHYVPTVLAGTRSTRNGVSIANSNVLYDFYTGQVLESAFQNSHGDVYHSRTVPAYVLYPEMGAKGDAPGNLHMLAQQAAAYAFREKRGVAYDPIRFLQTAEVLSASVQTWKGDWNNYRGVNGAGEYADLPGPYQPVWRQAASYYWQSPLLHPNGSYANFVDFTWGGLPDSHWVKNSETTRYDHYSHALESRDVNGAYNAVKTGYNQSQEIATVGNAKYTEFAYSGAEDPAVETPGYFGGEVSIGVGQRYASANVVAHTGQYCSRVGAQGTGFNFRGVVGTGVTNITAGTSYRLSTWVHRDDVGGVGRLFAALDNVPLAETSILATNTKRAGDWFRLDLVATVPASATAGQTVVFGCRNAGNDFVYFDDFRVCPLKANMSSKVYDPHSNRLTHVLDNENLYTRYEYNAAGRLLRVYKESFDRPSSNAPIAPPTSRLVKEYDYNYAHMTDPTWSVVGYRCEIDPFSGRTTGIELRDEVNINPLSLPQGATRTVRSGLSPACQECGGDPLWRYIAGRCQEAHVINCAPGDFEDGRQYYDYTIGWEYPNNVKVVLEVQQRLQACPN